jgi:hypothetical protein
MNCSVSKQVMGWESNLKTFPNKGAVTSGIPSPPLQKNIAMGFVSWAIVSDRYSISQTGPHGHLQEAQKLMALTDELANTTFLHTILKNIIGLFSDYSYYSDDAIRQS